MEDLKLNDISNTLLIINEVTINKLFSLKNDNAILLYFFYYKTAKWQNNNPIKATDLYVRKSLGWGSSKVTNAKNILKENGLIEIIKKRSEDNANISGWYVKINYLVSKNTQNQDINNQEHSFLEHSFTRTSKRETNTINNNINTINNNKKENLLKEKFFENEEVNNLFLEYLDFRKKLKAINSDRAIKLLINKLLPYDDNKKIEIINTSIERSWKSFFPSNKAESNETSLDKSFFEGLDKKYD